MKYALINAGVVENVVICDVSFISNYESDYDEVIDVTGQYVGPGFTYDGQSFTAPPQPEEP